MITKQVCHTCLSLCKNLCPLIENPPLLSLFDQGSGKFIHSDNILTPNPSHTNVSYRGRLTTPLGEYLRAFPFNGKRHPSCVVVGVVSSGKKAPKITPRRHSPIFPSQSSQLTLFDFSE